MNSNIFDQLRKQAQENESRWNQMSVLLESLKEQSKSGSVSKEIPEFLELLIKNLRPASNVEGEIAGVEQAMQDLQKVLGKKR